MNSKSGHNDKSNKPPKVNHSPKPKGVSNLVRSFNIRMLRYDTNAPLNWVVFLKDLSTVAGLSYGNLFMYVQDGKYPVFPDPILKSCEREEKQELQQIEDSHPDKNSLEYLEALVVHTARHNLSKAEKEVRNTMYLEDYRAARKVINELKAELNESKPKLYWLIKANCSPESLQCVSAKLLDQYEVMDREMDPLLLFKTLKETHTAFRSPFDASRARSKYYQLRQGEKESLIAFKEKMDTLLMAMESQGLRIPSAQEQAADLIAKVNTHFAPAATKINDECRMTGQYPKTSFEAFKLLTVLTGTRRKRNM